MPIDLHDPRAVAALLTAALDHLDVIQPPTLRAPLSDLLRAAIERCMRLRADGRSLLGRPIVYEIKLAEALIKAAESREIRYVGPRNPKP